MSALITGTVLALVALGFVLYPLFREGAPVVKRVRPVKATPEPSASERAVAILREVEFDRETGKLSESDYNALKSTYTREALAALRSEDAAAVTAAPGVADDEVEAVILKYRARPTVCEACGPRPEPDAIYCSSCGHYLAGVCGGCGAKITEAGARFCPSCGGSLAA
ncbi:MAG TPA: zinc ribbon domain-containing protein [Gemmatimonadaceae bacterium]|nr:zinc ribbon domain-containing protein [Gemmatimonadaceae bacterium]